MKAKIKIVVIVVVVIVLALILKTIFRSKSSQRIESKEHVVGKRDVCRAIYGSGSLVCSVRAGVITEIEGKLTEIKADEGDIVEAESILAAIDNENIENDVNIARGEVDERREKLEEVSHYTIVCLAEDWCLGILVNRDNIFARTHTGKVLNSS